VPKEELERIERERREIYDAAMEGDSRTLNLGGNDD